MQSTLTVSGNSARMVLSGDIDELLDWQHQQEARVKNNGGTLGFCSGDVTVLVVEYPEYSFGYNQIIRNR